MSRVAQAFKEEIVRVARKEIRAAIAGLHTSNVKLKKAAADHKQRIAALEAQNKRLMALASAVQVHQIDTASVADTKARITSKGMRSLRTRLGLSGEDFAKLLGTSAQTVYLWGRKEGALKLRPKTKVAFLSIRDIGAREAKARLAEMKEKNLKPNKPRKVQPKKAKK